MEKIHKAGADLKLENSFRSDSRYASAIDIVPFPERFAEYNVKTSWAKYATARNNRLPTTKLVVAVDGIYRVAIHASWMRHYLGRFVTKG